MRFATVGDNCVDAYETLGEYYLGGNPVNVAVYMQRMGEEASYTGVVGDDANGKKMIDGLKDKGVDVSHVRVLSGDTAVTKVEIVNGNRVFGDYIEGVLKDFKLTREDRKFLCSQDMIISGIWGKIEDDLPELKQSGVPIAFDFSDQPTHPIVKKAISYVDYAFFSDDEKDDAVLETFMKEMQSYGPKLVVITRGEKGSICYDGKEFYRFGILPCKVVDTMGAGDSYIAGFLRATMLGEDIETAMKMGAESSKITLGYAGAW